MTDGLFFERCRHQFFFAAGESKTAFEGWSSVSKKYLKQSMIRPNKWHNEKKTKIHRMSFDLMCSLTAEKLVNMLTKIIKVRVFIVVVNGTLSMGLYSVYSGEAVLRCTE